MPQHELLACAQCGCFAFSCFEDFAIRANSLSFSRTIRGSPPEADTSRNPPTLANKIESLGVHAAPKMMRPALDTVTAVPPDTGILRISPLTRAFKCLWRRSNNRWRKHGRRQNMARHVHELRSRILRSRDHATRAYRESVSGKGVTYVSGPRCQGSCRVGRTRTAPGRELDEEETKPYSVAFKQKMIDLRNAPTGRS